jgi:hypothetical protein
MVRDSFLLLLRGTQDSGGSPLPLASDTFYVEDEQKEFAQGDIIQDVPFVRVNASPLLLLRHPDKIQRPPLPTELWNTHLESALGDAFAIDGMEFAVTRIERLACMLITPTCSLDAGYWIFSPLHLLQGQPNIRSETLFSIRNGYFNLLGLPACPPLLPEDTYIDLNDLVQVNNKQIKLADRLLSLSRESATFLSQKLANFQGRDWGFAPGDIIEEDGIYRCRVCALYLGALLEDQALKKGQQAPGCPFCESKRRRPSWILLIQPKQKNLPFPRETQNAHSSKGQITQE